MVSDAFDRKATASASPVPSLNIQEIFTQSLQFTKHYFKHFVSNSNSLTPHNGIEGEAGV